MINALSTLRHAKTRRSSSWDKTGRNADTWTIAPGETRVLADIGIVDSFQSPLFTASTARNNQFNQGCALNCYARMPFGERALVTLAYNFPPLGAPAFRRDDMFRGRKGCSIRIEKAKASPFLLRCTKQTPPAAMRLASPFFSSSKNFAFVNHGPGREPR